MSYVFNGAGDRIGLANAPIAAPSQVTIIAWIKPSAWTGRDTVLAHYHDGTDHYFGLHVGPLGSPGGGSVMFRAPWSGGNGFWKGPGDLLALDGWVAVAASYDAGSASNDPIFYIKPEGGSISTPAVTEENAPAGSFDPSVTQLWVGGVNFGYFLTGRIAYVREFLSVLSQAEVEAEMDAMAAVLTAELNLPLVDDSNDDSGNNHNGTVTGATLDADNPTLAGGGGGGGTGHVYQRRMRRFISGV